MAKPYRHLPSRILVLGSTSVIASGVMRPLAARGASFYLVARNPEKLAVVAADLHTRGAAAVHTRVMDLDDTAAHIAMLAEATQKLGTIEMALLAHGILGDQEKAQADYTVAETILRTNFLSAVSLITWLANYFEQSRQGILAVISSVAGDRGRKSNYVYGASKGALDIFLDGVRNRIDRSGVQVLTIKPGFVATPMTAHLEQNALFAHPYGVGQSILRAIDKGKNIAYVPPIWAVIMFLIRAIPRSIFKKMNL